MSATEKSCVHPELPFARARIPGMMSEMWPSVLAAGLLATTGNVFAGGWSTSATSTQVAPGGGFTVTSIYNYDGNCGVRARVRYVSGSCAPGGDTGWQGHTSNCSGGGTASRAYTMNASPVAPCLISGDGTDNTSHYYNKTYTIQATQSITVTTAPPASAQGGNSFPVAATASSGLSVSVGVSGNCTYSAPNVTMTKTTGTCTVTFSRGDNGTGTWVPAADKVYSVNATGLAQTITVTTPAPASAAYNSSFTVAATTNAVPARAVAITTAGSCSGSGSGSATITMTSGTGTCTVYYNQTDNSPSYAPAAQVSSGTTATKIGQTLTFPAQTTGSRLFVLNSTFAISPVATSASPNSGNAITYSSLATGVCTVSGTTVTMKSAGNCILAADQTGNANYNAAPQAAQIVQLTKNLQKILVTTSAPGVKASNGSFSVAAESRAVATNALTGLAVTIQAMGNCSLTAGGSNTATIRMGAGSSICSVLYTQPGDVNYEAADPITEYTTPDTSGGSGCFGEGVYTSLQFDNTGGYLGWACNDGDYAAPGHSISCWPPIWWDVWPIYQKGWSIQPGSGFKGHVLQTLRNPGKTFKVQKAPGGGDFYNVLNTTDATCLASGNGVYESSGTRKGSNSSAGYLVAIQDTATLPGQYCNYSAAQTKWTMTINGSNATFATAGYPSWPSAGCMGSDSGAALSRRLIKPWDAGNFGHWGDSWVRNALPSCNSGGAKIKCGGYQPPPPDHIRFEFDSTKTYTCGAKVAIKMCTNPAPGVGNEGTCDLSTGYAMLKPVATKGTWSGLTAAPFTGFIEASTGIALSYPTLGDAVNLSYLNASMTLQDTALECYDTSSKKQVSCTAAFTYKMCPPFDAVEQGADLGANLYTKLAGTDFNVDVVTGNTGYVGNATVSLLDVSGAGGDPAPSIVDGTVDCATGAALPGAQFTVPAPAVAAAKTYAYIAADSGRKTFTLRYDNAAANVKMRIVDKDGKCFNSTDAFSIRPSKLVLATTLAGATATAEVDFTLTATAKNSANNTTTGYAGVGVLPEAYGVFIYDWDDKKVDPLLSGVFADAVAGVATGTAFKLSVVGEVYFYDYDHDHDAHKVVGKHDNWEKFATSSVGDQTFTQNSGDQGNGDCVSGSYSNTLTGGKYGCHIGSTALTLPRFIPDHYEVDNRIESLCGGVGGMTYFRQSFSTPTDASVRAMGKDGNALKNLTSAYTAAYRPSFTIVAVNGGAATAPVSVDLTTPFDWSADPKLGGAYDNNSSGQITGLAAVVAPAAPPNFESFGLKTTITDPDDVKITKCMTGNLATIPKTFVAGVDEGGGKSSCTSPPTRMRYGVLKLEDTYGSDQLPQYMRVEARYWNAASGAWLRNDLDNCTKLLTATSNADRNIAVGNFKGSLASGDISVTAADLTLAGGRGTIRFEPAPGKVGSANVAINLNPGTTHIDSSCVTWGTGGNAPNSTNGAGFDYLKGAWCGAAYDKDPSATIHFGNPKSQFLYMRERY